MFKRLSILLLLPWVLLGDVTVEILPREITVDDSARLILRIDGGLAGRLPEPVLPDGLWISGTSQQHTIINGAQSTTLEYQIRARRAGEYQIGPFPVEVRGRRYTADAVRLSVKPPQVVHNVDELFVTLEASANPVLVQQPVELILTFHSALPIEGLQQLEFDTSGFEVGEWQSIGDSERLINGRPYRIRRFVARAVPQQTGTFTLQPVFAVQVVERGGLTRDPFGMLRRSFDVRNLRASPDPLRIEVVPPPAEGRPAGFDGLIGRFHVTGTASPTTVKVGDPVTLRIQLSGSGAIRQALPPSYRDSPDFRAFAPRLVEEDIQRDGSSGRKVIEQVLIPRHAGVTEIPALEFSFYDPERKRYEQRVIGPFPLRVEAAPSGSGGPSVVSSLPAGSSGTAARIMGEDLLYLKTSAGAWIDSRGVFPIGGFAPLGLWALFALWARRADRLAADPEARRRRQAPRRLREALRRVDTLNDSRDLHAAFWEAIADVLRHRLGLAPGEIEPSRLPPSLSPGLRAAFTDWMTRCERARFAGAADVADLPKLRADMRVFLLALDKELSR